MNFKKYEKIPEVPIKGRKWPDNVITKAPIWCSVDLRDGNQALEVPMTMKQKLKFYDLLLKTGFKQIEIGFPAASETDYRFCRALIENDLIPDDVYIQVLTQSRQEIIEKTIDAVSGAKNVIIHLYNSTSTLQRDVVFGFGKEECKALAVQGAQTIKDYVEGDDSDTHYVLEYSPESYSSTEPDFAVEICDAVCDVWQPDADNKVIINLPETVEYTLPNVYADGIEYFAGKTRWRDKIILSVHTHNDRGTGVAASEMGLLAGADRVEGTLFGNGERTGNVDVVTLAINMMMQGVDPELDFSNLNKCVDIYEDCTGMKVDPRHPWSGKLVFTAFSGSHQDAISKGRKKMKERNSAIWAVPYLPIDPADVGRDYEPIIRINSQSGRGGISYVMEQYFGLTMPKSFQRDFLTVVKRETDDHSVELMPQQVFDLFDDNYINVMSPYWLSTFSEHSLGDKLSEVEANITYLGKPVTIKGTGKGLLDAFVDAFSNYTGTRFSINMYNEHALETGTESAAITYLEIKREEDGEIFLGAGVSSSVTKSSVRAVLSAYNRMIK
ncbi:MAG: 2-isopropylmalate synthase [Clostridiales bacterium]|nr:2-isopropylmalate synthase [Clostridiales bacterium]